LFRSARLAHATPSDRNKLANLLKDGMVIDLRSGIERTIGPDQPIQNVPNNSFPIQGAASASGYVSTFVNDKNSRTQFGTAITALANAKGGVLVHCTYGKDRTGWLVAMVMYILGADDRQVMNEYLKSNGQLSSASVDADWLNAALREAKQKYGSIDRYVEEGLNIDDTIIEKLKTKFAV